MKHVTKDSGEITLDFNRIDRQGFPEAILCGHKSTAQLVEILELAKAKDHPTLFTRLESRQFGEIPDQYSSLMDYDPVSRTAFWGPQPALEDQLDIAIVSAGSSDVPTAKEIKRTLNFAGYPVLEIHDVGVAGIWRLMDRLPDFDQKPIIMAVAGMDAALASVLGGLVEGVVIGVPTSTGYGVSDQGKTALRSMLASCAPGVPVMNIDNGYGAALAGIRILRQLRKVTS